MVTAVAAAAAGIGAVSQLPAALLLLNQPAGVGLSYWTGLTLRVTSVEVASVGPTSSIETVVGGALTCSATPVAAQLLINAAGPSASSPNQPL